MEEDVEIDYDYDKECQNDPNAFADYVNEIFIYLRYREVIFFNFLILKILIKIKFLAIFQS